MPKVTITALGTDINIQDPFPAEGQLSVKVAAGTSKTLDYVHWAQLQRIAPQMVALEGAKKLEYSIEASARDTRAQESDLEGLPNIDYVDTDTIAVAGQIGINMLGPAIEGYQQPFATLDLSDGTDPNAVVEVRSLLPGYDGNKYSVEVVDTGGGGLTVAVVADKITIDQGGSASDAGTVATAVNVDATAKTMVFCTAGGTGLGVVAAQTEANLAGGIGEGITLTCGGFPCTITTIVVGAQTRITFDVPALAPIIANQMVSLQLRSNAKMYVMSLPTV
jgi:hypothetical protein